MEDDLKSDPVRIRFKRPYSQQFMGTDLEVYGPFEVFDVVKMPEPNAQTLIDLGFAEEIG